MDYFSLNKATVTVETTTTTTTPSPLESAITDEEDYYFGENASVERAVASVEPYWASTLCKMRHSRNILVVAVRKYLDVTSYYIPIAGKEWPLLTWIYKLGRLGSYSYPKKKF